MESVEVYLHEARATFERSGHCEVTLKISVPYGDAAVDNLQRVMMAAKKDGRLTLVSDNVVAGVTEKDEIDMSDIMRRVRRNPITGGEPKPELVPVTIQEPKPEGYGSW